MSDIDFGSEKMEIYVLSCDGMFVGVRVWVLLVVVIREGCAKSGESKSQIHDQGGRL